jgi:hypothetical protein
MAPMTASAYIDPGSGSFLVQIVMSALFGAIFLARSFIARTASAAGRFFGRKPTEPPKPPEEPKA